MSRIRLQIKKDKLYYQAINDDKNRQKRAKKIIKYINHNNVLNFLDSNCINGYILDRCLCNNEFTSNPSYRRNYLDKLFKKIYNTLKKNLKNNTTNDNDCKIYRKNFTNLLLKLNTFYSKFNQFSNEIYIKYNDIKCDLEKKLLIKETKYKKNKSDMCINNGYIYLIQTRACINANESVYKVGKTRNEIGKRMAGYDKGYKIIYVKKILNYLDSLENAIINKLKEKTTLRKDYGREYFEADPYYITNIIDKIISESKKESRLVSF